MVTYLSYPTLKITSFLLFLTFFGGTSSLKAKNAPSTQENCFSCSLKEQSDKIMQKTLRDLYQKEIGEAPPSTSQENTPLSQQPRLYVFVSLSLSKQGLIDLGQQARHYGGVLVLRGLLQGSYKKTALYLKDFIEKTGSGVLIDPLLFREYKIQSVPFLVLTSSSGKAFDKVGGFIPVQTALERIAQEGEFKEDAVQILQKAALREREKP